ncbi:hypothetical protein WMY93_033074 [Mugilogobius chulae]|uniref:VWFA domain-containing protein n=1 Tax=Mugilogobius chulae TaxID=88201 RepID=A0AAW0MME9_9GOBI
MRRKRGETEGLPQTVCVMDIGKDTRRQGEETRRQGVREKRRGGEREEKLKDFCRRNRFNRSVVVSLRRSAVGEVLPALSRSSQTSSSALSEKFADVLFLVDSGFSLSEKFADVFFLVDSGILCLCRSNVLILVCLRRSAVGEVRRRLLTALSEKFADIFFLVDTLSEKFADIFFLVDSGISAQEFQQVRTFLSRMVTQLNVGADAYRIGLAQYGSSVKVEFLLNAHQTKEQTSASLKRLRQRRLQSGEQRNWARLWTTRGRTSSRLRPGVERSWDIDSIWWF